MEIKIFKGQGAADIQSVEREINEWLAQRVDGQVIDRQPHSAQLRSAAPAGLLRAPTRGIAQAPAGSGRTGNASDIPRPG